MTKPKLLVVEDDPALGRQLRWTWDDYDVLLAADRAGALDALHAERPPVVTLDLGLPPDPDGTTEGFATLRAILDAAPATKVIVASGHGARENALRAIDAGAWDFTTKPLDVDTLGLIVQRAFHVHALEAENRRLAQAAVPNAAGEIVTAAPAMLACLRTVERVADTDVSVLVLGASGTGKELVARRLHAGGKRVGGPFVAINCAAIPDALLEAELFGYERGAFTGAVKTTDGKVELASGGTLFLDEIADVPLSLQAKLLRFLQERVIERIGGRKAIPVDVRIVAATHGDVPALVREGRFREDLYYRLAEITLDIPPLRDRPGDPVLLARLFAERFARGMGRAAKPFAPAAVDALAAHAWPGNVRELENRVKRAVLMADGRAIAPEDLDLGPIADEAIELRAVREAADRRAIAQALARADGNVSGAARLLGVSRPTLYDLLKQYGMRADEAA